MTSKTRRSTLTTFARIAMLASVLIAGGAGVVTGHAAPALAQGAGLRVTEIATSRGYAAATGATDPTASFRRADGRVFVVIRLENPTGAEQDITVAFERAEGTPAVGARGGVTLHVPASRRYRTVARTSSDRAPGRYRAVVRDSSGAVLETVEFEITE